MIYSTKNIVSVTAYILHPVSYILLFVFYHNNILKSILTYIKINDKINISGQWSVISGQKLVAIIYVLKGEADI